MPKTLKVPTSVYTMVFRRLVRQLEADTRFRAVVTPDRLMSWKGLPSDGNPLTPAIGKPVVRLTPHPMHGDWYSPDTQVTWLAVDVELTISGYSSDDVCDLWDCLLSALRPGAGTLAADLVADGAETGEVLFSDPAFDQKRDENASSSWYSIGRFKLAVLRSVNP
jgi:hypothetical protein